ncbi:hypothetical protein TNIN_444791 [Trichonephila inaurata madagascariensis]|uniref:Uncharacterized protein n=1 Tax=Trichonephila inaurata madagascariensis TaxID=2747483 RepID=A0A8X6Y8T0_9ARAC|nr:hypothetical protein TNIN_444791 [Trichonephila inaurata madagascariensis]
MHQVKFRRRISIESIFYAVENNSRQNRLRQTEEEGFVLDVRTRKSGGETEEFFSIVCLKRALRITSDLEIAACPITSVHCCRYGNLRPPPRLPNTLLDMDTVKRTGR